MNPQKKMVDLSGELIVKIVNEALQAPTYGEAIKKLKHDQDEMADYLEPGCPLAVARAVAQVTNAIYGEAIDQLYTIVKSQPIQHR